MGCVCTLANHMTPIGVGGGGGGVWGVGGVTLIP